MIPEAALQQTEAGLAPTGPGWFVLGALDASWSRRPGRGVHLAVTGATDEECERYFPRLGVKLAVLWPGEPIGTYHWEADPEAFLILSGEALLLIEGKERPLRQWDFVYCPPQTNHVIVGSGEGPCTVLAVGTREHMTDPDWGGYTVDEAALRHGVGVEAETSDAAVAYARFPAQEPAPYEPGWLPSSRP